MNEEKRHIGDEVLLSYLQGELSEKESLEVERWLQLSKANSQILDDLESVWLESGKLNPVPVAVDTDLAWINVQKKLESTTDQKSKSKKITLSPLLRIAAILVIIFGLYQIFIVDTSQPIEIASGFAILKDTLSDGTNIALNANSTLKVGEKFNSKRREVVLTGEAFFDVKPDRNKPFIIQTGKSEVAVLGTSFNVKSYPDSLVEVFVKTGVVKLYMIDEESGDTASVLLRAGEKGIIPEKTELPQKVTEKPNELFWLNRTLEFKETKLSSVFALLEKYYNVTINAGKEIVEESRLSSTFKDESIESILEVIAASFELKVRKDSTNFILEKDELPKENK